MGENGDKKGMTVKDYEKTEAYMLSCMNDSAHDKEHVYRVLYYALEIAKPEPDVDYEILITSCLLHDIGRWRQYEEDIPHEEAGAALAADILEDTSFSRNEIRQILEAIGSHREKPSKEVEIFSHLLYQADKRSRVCWLCEAQDACYWPKEQKNRTIMD